MADARLIKETGSGLKAGEKGDPAMVAAAFAEDGVWLATARPSKVGHKSLNG